MCRATAFQSRTCRHRWLTITTPCSPAVGFDNAPHHRFDTDTALLGGPKYVPAPAHSCPECNKKGQYDGNRTRMVVGKDGFCGVGEAGAPAYGWASAFGTGYAGSGYGGYWYRGGFGGWRNGFGWEDGYVTREPAVCCSVM
jgi:hypothetical protein